MKRQITLLLLVSLLIVLCLGEIQNDQPKDESKIKIAVTDIKSEKDQHQEKMKAVLAELKEEIAKKGENPSVESKKEVPHTLPPVNTIKNEPPIKSPEANAEIDVVDSPFKWFFGEDTDPFQRFFKLDFKKQWDPSVNIHTSEMEDTFLVELPGVKRENIKIELKKDRKEVLTVSGKRDRVESLGKRLQEQIEHGTFEKSYIVQRTTGKITAVLKDGILKIVVEKKPIERRRVEVVIE
jgi:HSP20 family protein